MTTTVADLAEQLAREDLYCMAIIPGQPLAEEIRLRAAEHADSLIGNDFLNLDRIVDWLHLYGAKAYVEQTGGGCATIYVGERALDRYDDGDLFYPVAMGPGWFEGPGWTKGRASGHDFYIGPDDNDGDKFHTAGPETTELECAWLAIHYLNGVADPLDMTGAGPVVAKATPIGPPICVAEPSGDVIEGEIVAASQAITA